MQQVADMHDQLLDFEGQLQGLGEGLVAGGIQTSPAAAAYHHNQQQQQQQSDEEAQAATSAAAAIASGAGRNSSSSSSSSKLKNARGVKGASVSSKAAGAVNKQQALSQLRARQQQHLQHKAAMAAAAAVQKRGVPGATKAPMKPPAAAPAAALSQPVAGQAAQQDASWIEESLLVAAGPAQAAAAAAAGTTGEAGLGPCPSSSRLAAVQDKLAAKLQEQREALHAQRQQLQREREQYQSQAAAAGSSGAGGGDKHGQGRSSGSSSIRVLQQQQQPEQDPVLVENEQVEVMFLNDLEESAAFAALESSPPAAQRTQFPVQGHSSGSRSKVAGSPVGWQEAAPLCSSPIPRSAVATPVPAAVALRHSGTKAAGPSTWGWNARAAEPQPDTWQDVSEGLGPQQEPEGYGDSYDGGVQATPPPAQQAEVGRGGSSTGKSRAGLGPSSWRAYMQEQQDWVDSS
jgi:hypothetical protein